MIYGPPAPVMPELETGLELQTERPDAPKSYDDELCWQAYAAAALSSLIHTDTSPTHAAERAARYADAMLAEHGRRFQ